MKQINNFLENKRISNKTNIVEDEKYDIPEDAELAVFNFTGAHGGGNFYFMSMAEFEEEVPFGHDMISKLGKVGACITQDNYTIIQLTGY